MQIFAKLQTRKLSELSYITWEMVITRKKNFANYRLVEYHSPTALKHRDSLPLRISAFTTVNSYLVSWGYWLLSIESHRFRGIGASSAQEITNKLVIHPETIAISSFVMPIFAVYGVRSLYSLPLTDTNGARWPVAFFARGPVTFSVCWIIDRWIVSLTNCPSTSYLSTNWRLVKLPLEKQLFWWIVATQEKGQCTKMTLKESKNNTVKRKPSGMGTP